jgi:hypothetical protein
VNIKTLLAECARLSHGERMQLMVDLGRRSTTEPEVAGSLAALARGDVYQRMLAAQSCFGSRDSALALAAVRDPSSLVRSSAFAALRVIGADETLVAALDQQPAHRVPAQLRALAGRRRRSAADAYLRRLAERGGPAGPLLPYGSLGLVEALIGEFADSYSSQDWARLARHHPAIAARMLRERAVAASEQDNRLVANVNAVLARLAEDLPAAALGLVEALLRTTPLSWLALAPLLRRRPAQVVELILAARAQVRLDWARIVARLSGDQQRALAEAGLLPAVSARMLRRMAPRDRAALYAAGGRSWQSAEGIISPDIVALLPAAQREAEARRHWNLPALQTRPLALLPYAALLPWEAALAATEPTLRNPDPNLRSAALAALIGAARYDSARLPDVLALLAARKNEQDPVRLSGLTALANLPPSRWAAEHLDGLGQIIRAALDAADCSSATATAAERLAGQLLPTHFAWAATTLATLARERGYLTWGGLSTLPGAQVRRLEGHLLPVFQSWATRESERSLLVAARTFGRRLQVMPGLLGLLEDLARSASSQMTADGALNLIWEHDRARSARLIPALLAEDGSWFTRPVVYQHLHRTRQDLLTPYLGQSTFQGRFSTGKTYLVLPIYSGFARWTPEQQTIFAGTLGRLLQDAQRDTPALIRAINQLAAMPAVPPDHLIRLADLSNEKLAVRDAALRALGRVDSGAGIPALLAAMEDDRGRIAIYALRASLREMPADQAIALLRGVPLGKVTVAKEVMRLLGEVRSPEAFRLLLEFNGRDLHRDVRIALLRALWDWTELPETWAVLDAAAAHPDPAVAAGVIRIPADRMSPAAQARLARLLAALLRHPEPRVRLDVLTRCAQLPLHDAERQLAAPLLDCLASALPDETQAAARAVFATYAGSDVEPLRAAIARIIANRQALQTAVGVFVNEVSRWQGPYWRGMALAILETLERDPVTFGLQLQLATLAYRQAELVRWLSERAPLLHADALAAATQALGRASARMEPAELAELEAALAGSSAERLRRLGLSLLTLLAHRPQGWDAGLRARLRAYQSDRSLLVASAAQWVFPPPEPDGATGN